eukprot:CAMPEP_0182456926 /NCGR_PEP_ID=MMETSP1319-20130603/2630_1 /TAXON_ID=172717 /ORGANISM="Bolidomonas pacifica, Strain RCC208" /LENGTH=241 /DNA_ID=CAMNT_0024655283 /DNA_START=41 /DNA_END=766 /DNA_ORIENTATION=-
MKSSAFLLLLLPLASSFTFLPTNRPSSTSLASSTYTLDGRAISNPVEPTNNFILVKLDEAADETDGGIILTKKAKQKVTSGTVVAVGPGRSHPDSGILMKVFVEAGEKVIYGQYDGTEIDYQGSKHTLIRDSDVLVKYTGEALTTDNAQTINDKMLVKVESNEQETAGGLLIAPTAQKSSRASVGEVVAVGPGRAAMNGEVIAMEVSRGDMVKFRDFAGNDVKIGDDDYTVITMNDCLARY